MADYSLIESALQRGYSMDEIADKLAQAEGFDPSAIRARGYGAEEIIGRLGYVKPETSYVKPETSDVARGFVTSFKQLPQLGYGLLAGAGAVAESVAGEGGVSTSMKNFGVKKYQEAGADIEKDSKQSDSLSYSWEQAKQGDFGSLVDWLQYGIGYGGGQAVQALATAGVGSLVGKTVLKGTAENLASKMVAKEALRLGATEEAKRLTAQEISKIAVANVASNIGQTVAIGSQAFGMEGGEIFGDLAQKTVKEGRAATGGELAKAFGATAAAGALEFVGDKLGVDVMLGKSKMFKPASSMTGVGGRAARAAVAVPGTVLAEGGTEYLQTGIEEYGKGNEKNFLPFMQSESAQKQALDAAGLGAVGGGGMAMVGGAFSSPQKKDAAPSPSPSISSAQTADDAIAAFQDEVASVTPRGSFGNMDELAGLIESERSDLGKRRGLLAQQQQEARDMEAEFSGLVKDEQIDQSYRLNDAQKQRDAERAREGGYDLALQQREEQQGRTVEQLAAASEAQGFGNEEPTAMQLAMQQAQQKALDNEFSGLLKQERASLNEMRANVKRVAGVPVEQISTPQLEEIAQSEAHPNTKMAAVAALNDRHDAIQQERERLMQLRETRLEKQSNQPEQGEQHGAESHGTDGQVATPSVAGGGANVSGGGFDAAMVAADRGMRETASAGAAVSSGGQVGAVPVADQPTNVRAEDGKPSASWVIRNKETGESLFETFDRKKVDALNTEKYEAVPILEYLQSLNKPRADSPNDAQIVNVRQHTTRRKPASNTIAQAIINLGGISTSLKTDILGDASIKTRPGLFTTNGTGDLGEIAAMLSSGFGFSQIDLNDPTDNSGAKQLADLIARSVNGETIHNEEGMILAQQDEEFEQAKAEVNLQAQEIGIKPIRGKRTIDIVQSEINAILAEREEMSRQKKKAQLLLDEVAEQELIEAFDLAMQEYHDETAISRDESRVESARLSAEESAQGDGDSVNQASQVAGRASPTEGGRGEEVTPEFGLVGQTEEEAIAEEQARRDEDQRKADEDRAEKRRIDAEAVARRNEQNANTVASDNFQLGQSSQEVRRMVHSGMVDMFGNPTTEADDGNPARKMDEAARQAANISDDHANIPNMDGVRAAAQQILDAIEQDDLADYGLRVIPGEFEGDIAVGDVLPPSRVWEDGRETDDELLGTSTVEVGSLTLDGVLKSLNGLGAAGKPGPNGYYFGDRVVLVKGDRVSGGDDSGESLLKNASVVGVWRKASKGLSSILPNEAVAPKESGANTLDPVAAVKATLDAAGVTGTDRTSTIAAVRRGDLTPEDVAEAHPSPNVADSASEGKPIRPYATPDERNEAIWTLQAEAKSSGLEYSNESIKDAAEFGAPANEIAAAIDAGEDAVADLAERYAKRSNGLRQGFGQGNNDNALRENMKPPSEHEKRIASLTGRGLYELTEAQRSSLLKFAKVRSIDAFEEIAFSARREIIGRWLDMNPAVDKRSSDVAMFNAKSGSIGNPIDTATLESTIASVIAASPSQWSRDTVVTATLFSELPAPIVEKAKAEGYDAHGRNRDGQKLTGATYDGKVYLVQENISSEIEAEETLLHERIHQILHGNAEDKNGKALRQSLGRLYSRIGGKDAIVALAKRIGADMSGPLAALPKVAVRNRPAFLVDEFLAHVEGQRAYEKFPQSVVRAIREFYGEFRDWLRSSKFVKIADAVGVNIGTFTQSDLSWTLKKIRQQQAGTGSKAIRFMTAWHGSPHDHDGFDSSKIGTGEGAQAYGSGLYFSSVREIAEHYRNSLSDGIRGGLGLAGVMPSSTDKRLSYNTWSAAKKLSELLVSKSDVVQPFSKLDVVTQNGVLSNVVDLLHDFEVLNTVVRLIPIDVVNMLSGKKFSSDALLNNPSMLIDLLPTNANDLVPSRIQAVNVLTASVALSAAKIHTGLARFDVTARDFYTASGAIRHDISPDVLGKIPHPNEFVKGRLYQVELAPAEDEYLDWDKPLSGQSAKVKAALGGAQWDGKGTVGYWMDRSTENQAYDGGDLYVRLSGSLGSDKAASEYLHSIGIRGIKYLDGISRDAKKGSHNYVIFNDADVKITAKESRRASNDADRQRVADFWKAIASNPTMFKYGLPNKGETIADKIAEQVSTDNMRISGTETGDSHAWFSSDNGGLAVFPANDKRNSEGGYAEYLIQSPGAGSAGKANGGGSALYQAAMRWVAANGGKFVGDGQLTPINVLRVTSNMLSSALREGTTSHLHPDDGQAIVGWQDGNDDGNIAALAIREMELVHERIPEAANYTYLPDRNRIVDAEGKELEPGESGALLRRLDTDHSQGVGEASFARALATRSALEGTGADGRSGRELASRDSGIAGTKKPLYSKTTTPANAGVSVSAPSESVRRIQSVVERFKSQFKGTSALDIRVVSTTFDIPARFRPSPFAEGVFHDDAGLVYLVTMNLHNPRGELSENRAWQVLLHESVGHYGLSQMMGDKFGGILKAVKQATLAGRKVSETQSNPLQPGDKDYTTWEAVKLRYPKASDAEVAQEVLARMSETDPGSSIVGYAVATVRQWVRDVARAMGVNVVVSTSELRDLVAKASGYMRRGDNLAEERVPSGLVAASQKVGAGETAFNLVDVTSAAFKKWFGDSKVVDADGNPLRVYHGTDADLTEFKRVDSRTGHPSAQLGVFFTASAKVADRFNRVKTDLPFSDIGKLDFAEGANQLPVYLSIKNPAVLSAKEFRDLMVDLGSPPDKVYGWMRTPEGWAALRDHFINAEGRDGVKILAERNVYSGSGLEEYAADQYVAFNPTQIKSAISNTGAFDSTNPSILESRAAQGKPQGPIWNSPESSRADDVIYTMQDKNIDLKRVQQAIKEAVGEIRDDIDAYLQEELFHGRAAKITEEFLDKEVNPLISLMRASNVSMEEMETFLWARHAKERNAQIAKINDEMPDGGSGLTNKQADDLMAGKDVTIGDKTIEGVKPNRKELLSNLAGRVDAITRGNRALLERYSLESADTLNAWDGAYKHYVPLHREDTDSHLAGMGTGQGYSVKGSSSKRATGSSRPVENILANLVLQRERIITRGEKNRVAQSLYGLAKEMPNADLWEVDVKPTMRTTAMVEGREQVVDAVDPNFRNRPNVVFARFNGEDHFIVFNERNERAVRMAQALKNLDADDISHLLGEVSRWTRYFASINTQYNPIFGVTNLVRDVQTGLLNLKSTPIAGKQKEMMGHLVQALPAVFKALRAGRKGQAATGTWAQLWEEFQEIGGQTGYRNMFRNGQERAEALQNALDPTWWQKTWWGKAATVGGVLAVPEQAFLDKFGKPFMELLSDYNTMMENGIRLAAYKVALDTGMTQARAASLAKNLTVNFNRKGQAARQVGAMYAFFNASVQGTARMAETLNHGAKPGELLGKAGKQIVYGGLLLGAVQAMLLMAAGFDDEEPPEFVRDRNIIIPTGNGKYVSIPMPLGFHVLPAISRISIEFTAGGFKKPGEHLVHIMDVLLDSFNPIGNAGLSMQTVAPTVLDPIAALTENKDWSGRQIARQDFSKLNPTPGYTRAKDTASSLSRGLAYAFNYLSGGGEYGIGIVSPTPDQIDYLLGQLTGGVGREVGKVLTTGETMATGEDLPPHKIPLVGRFYGDTTGQSSEASKFYGTLEKLSEHRGTLDRMKDAHDLEAYREYAKEHPESRFYDRANKVQRELSSLRKLKRKMIERNADRAKVRQIEDRMRTLMTRFNQSVSEQKGDH